MTRKTKILIAGAVVAVLALGGAGAAVAVGGDDSEPPITGPALEQASAAALAYTGDGTVTDTEVGDEESYYEVEVTLEDGTQIDVQLDEQFQVVGSETEDEVDDD
jgi:uncharacterized membrane protein YkoI